MKKYVVFCLLVLMSVCGYAQHIKAIERIEPIDFDYKVDKAVEARRNLEDKFYKKYPEFDSKYVKSYAPQLTNFLIDLYKADPNFELLGFKAEKNTFYLAYKSKGKTKYKYIQTETYRNTNFSWAQAKYGDKAKYTESLKKYTDDMRAAIKKITGKDAPADKKLWYMNNLNADVGRGEHYVMRGDLYIKLGQDKGFQLKYGDDVFIFCRRSTFEEAQMLFFKKGDKTYSGPFNVKSLKAEDIILPKLTKDEKTGAGDIARWGTWDKGYILPDWYFETYCVGHYTL